MITVERDALLDAVEAVRLGSYRSANETAPVHLVADGAGLFLTADNLDIRAEASVEYATAEPLDIFAPWATLHDALKTIPGGRVDLDASDGQLVIAGGPYTYELALLDVEAVPRRQATKVAGSVHFDAGVWANVARVSRAHDGASAEWQRDLHISAGWAWATETHVLARTPVDVDPEVALRIPGLVIEGVLKLKPTEVTLTWGAQDFEITTDRGHWRGKLGQAEAAPAPARVASMFGRDRPIEVTVNRAELVEAVTAVAKVGKSLGNLVNRIEVHASGDTIEVRRAAADARSAAALAGKTTPDGVVVHFNAPLLLTLLGMSDDEEVTLHGAPKNGFPWLVRSEAVEAILQSITAA